MRGKNHCRFWTWALEVEAPADRGGAEEGPRRHATSARESQPRPQQARMRKCTTRKTLGQHMCGNWWFRRAWRLLWLASERDGGRDSQVLAGSLCQNYYLQPQARISWRRSLMLGCHPLPTPFSPVISNQKPRSPTTCHHVSPHMLPPHRRGRPGCRRRFHAHHVVIRRRRDRRHQHCRPCHLHSSRLHQVQARQADQVQSVQRRLQEEGKRQCPAPSLYLDSFHPCMRPVGVELTPVWHLLT